MSAYSFENKKINLSKGFEFAFCLRQNANRYTFGDRYDRRSKIFLMLGRAAAIASG
jgi:hypothetical protein